MQRRSVDTGNDFEAVATDSTGRVLVMEEGMRRLIEFDPATLRRGAVHEVTWGGGRNKGIEALTWNPVRHCYLAATGCNSKTPTIYLLDHEANTFRSDQFRCVLGFSG